MFWKSFLWNQAEVIKKGEEVDFEKMEPASVNIISLFDMQRGSWAPVQHL